MTRVKWFQRPHQPVDVVTVEPAATPSGPDAGRRTDLSTAPDAELRTMANAGVWRWARIIMRSSRR
ncbi:hypothetical protein TPA0907_08120 [Micromonospora humidisoli]|uniref:Uncharacterized protein n=1 Tax=Micromonospora humidisoli TaxID=2807622 RepID=A0ABS2JD76_9ACTN|nr:MULTISPECIES: hypothetical protein [Micromonospora]MBM7084309.1 hypothetical protein [Micromonospora humidisoli]GHJ06445.1 hypothetical protein TPA0907_08120 [Micromonospora sp. AKA109]